MGWPEAVFGCFAFLCIAAMVWALVYGTKEETNGRKKK